MSFVSKTRLRKRLIMSTNWITDYIPVSKKISPIRTRKRKRSSVSSTHKDGLLRVQLSQKNYVLLMKRMSKRLKVQFQHLRSQESWENSRWSAEKFHSFTTTFLWDKTLIKSDSIYTQLNKKLLLREVFRLLLPQSHLIQTRTICSFLLLIEAKC